MAEVLLMPPLQLPPCELQNLIRLLVVKLPRLGGGKLAHFVFASKVKQEEANHDTAFILFSFIFGIVF